MLSLLFDGCISYVSSDNSMNPFSQYYALDPSCSRDERKREQLVKLRGSGNHDELNNIFVFLRYRLEANKTTPSFGVFEIKLRHPKS